VKETKNESQTVISPLSVKRSSINSLVTHFTFQNKRKRERAIRGREQRKERKREDKSRAENGQKNRHRREEREEGSIAGLVNK